MTVETARRRADQRATSSPPPIGVEALVAAYIHELSPRHDAEREAGRANLDSG